MERIWFLITSLSNDSERHTDYRSECYGAIGSVPLVFIMRVLWLAQQWRALTGNLHK